MQDEAGGATTAPVAYEGAAWPLFWLAVKTLVLTVLTLGIYRFWMKTRLRRYYWSAVRVAGEPFEYTGRAAELLLGFLLAVVVLAVYLAFFNLLLAFVGMSYFQGNPVALNLSLVAILPVIFYAQYRARRYLLSRTRWRGIRFAAEKGAVGYAWRACLYLVAAVASLGLLVPWMQFRLAKFSMDRTWFGDRRFVQHGRWTGLLFYWLWALLPVLALGVLALATLAEATDNFRRSADEAAILELGGFGAAILVVWVVSAVYYNARSFRYLYNHRTLGETVGLRSDLRARQVFGVYLVAIIGFGVAGMALMAGLGVLGVLVALAAEGAAPALESLFTGAAAGETPGYVALGLIAVVYLLFFALFSALTHVFLTQPMLRLFAQSLEIEGAEALDRVRQRAGEDLAEAEGFADALDVGAAF